MSEFIFEDGYICYCKGFSAFEMKVEVNKHGRLISRRKMF